MSPATTSPSPPLATLTLAAAALLSMLVGGLVYVLDRPAGSAWLLPAQWQVHGATPRFGDIGGWLPSFVHAFAFSALTALLLPHRLRFAAAACLAWAAIDTLAELGQTAAVSSWLAPLIESSLDGGPFGRRLAQYFSRGVFDAADVAAGLAGCASAYAVLAFGYWVRSRRLAGPSPRGG